MSVRAIFLAAVADMETPTAGADADAAAAGALTAVLHSLAHAESRESAGRQRALAPRSRLLDRAAVIRRRVFERFQINGFDDELRKRIGQQIA